VQLQVDITPNLQPCSAMIGLPVKGVPAGLENYWITLCSDKCHFIGRQVALLNFSGLKFNKDSLIKRTFNKIWCPHGSAEAAAGRHKA
jgi:hypothetical protein